MIYIIGGTLLAAEQDRVARGIPYHDAVVMSAEMASERLRGVKLKKDDTIITTVLHLIHWGSARDLIQQIKVLELTQEEN